MSRFVTPKGAVSLTNESVNQGSTFKIPLEYDHSHIKVNGITFPELQSTDDQKSLYNIEYISEFNRNADTADGNGKSIGKKAKITIKYKMLNKKAFDNIYKATAGAISGKQFFHRVQIPTFGPEGIKTFVCYMGSEFSTNCTYNTEDIFTNKDSRYRIGGSKYDELHEDVTLTFIEK
jgi:hypothetical protein